MELLEQGMLPALVLVIYSMIDKVIVPLLKGRGNGKQPEQAERGHACDLRIDRNERDIDRNRISIEGMRNALHDIRDQGSAISGQVGVAHAILERIEQRLE